MEDLSVEILTLLLPLIPAVVAYVVDVLRKKGVSDVERQIRLERLQTEAHNTVLGVAKMVALKVQKEYGSSHDGAYRANLAQEYFTAHPEVVARVEALGIDANRVDEYIKRGYEIMKKSYPHLFEIQVDSELLEADQEHFDSMLERAEEVE